MLGNLISRTAKTKTGMTAVAGVVVSALTITIEFGGNFVRTFELSDRGTERVELVEGFLVSITKTLTPALFLGAFVFRGVSKKGFEDENGDGIPDRLQGLQETQDAVNVKMNDMLSRVSRMAGSNNDDAIATINQEQHEVKAQVQQLLEMMQQNTVQIRGGAIAKKPSIANVRDTFDMDVDPSDDVWQEQLEGRSGGSGADSEVRSGGKTNRNDRDFLI